MFRKRTLWLDEATRQQTYMELEPAVDVLTKRMHQLIGNYDSWDMTISLWAYGLLGHQDEAALHALCDAAVGVAPIFKPADCANVLVAFANLDFLHRDLLKQIVTTVLDTIDDFQPGEIAQILWGFAHLGCHPGEPFLAEMVEVVQWRMGYYSTQELVLVLWSLVRLRYRPGLRFLQAAEATLLGRLPHMVPADICVSIWSFAHLRYKAVRLLDEVPQAIGPQLHACKNGELCALVSAFATAHHYHRSLLEAAAAVCLSRLESFSPQEVCVLLWTYGTFRHRPSHPDFARCLAATLAQRMRQFTPQGLAMIAKALAQLQWRSEPLLAQLVAAAEAQLGAFKPLELSQLLWGLSALQWRARGIYYSVVRRCIAILQDDQHPHLRTMMQHRVVNSVVASCQQLGYVPWTLIDFAESKGIRVRQPEVLSSRDEDDEGLPVAATQQEEGDEDEVEEGQEETAPTGAAGSAWAPDEEEEGGEGWRYDVGRLAASEAALGMQQGVGGGRGRRQLRQPEGAAAAAPPPPQASPEQLAHAREQAELLRQQAASAPAAFAAAGIDDGSGGGGDDAASFCVANGRLWGREGSDGARQSAPPPQPHLHSRPHGVLSRLDGGPGVSEPQELAAAVAAATVMSSTSLDGTAVRVLAPRPRARRPMGQSRPTDRTSTAAAADVANGAIEAAGAASPPGPDYLQRPSRPQPPHDNADGGAFVGGGPRVGEGGGAVTEAQAAQSAAVPSSSHNGLDGPVAHGAVQGHGHDGSGGAGLHHEGTNGAAAMPVVPPPVVTLERRPYMPGGQQLPLASRRVR